MKKIIILSGALATGKTTYSKILSEKFNIVVFNKDSLKEKLSDVFGFSNREENLLLSKGAYKMFCYIFESFADRNMPLILESNFHQDELIYLNELINKYKYDVLNIVFYGDFEILFERFERRAKWENRHPCHLTGPVTNSAFKKYLEENNKVEYYGPLISINANDFKYQESEKLFSQINDFLNK